jgi:hypothetical protein
MTSGAQSAVFPLENANQSSPKPMPTVLLMFEMKPLSTSSTVPRNPGPMPEPALPPGGLKPKTTCGSSSSV